MPCLSFCLPNIQFSAQVAKMYQIWQPPDQTTIWTFCPSALKKLPTLIDSVKHELHNYDNQAVALTPFCQPNCKTMTTKLLLWHHSANQTEKKTHPPAVLSRQEGHMDWCLWSSCRLDQPSIKATSQHSPCLRTLLVWCLSAPFPWHGFAFRLSFTYSKCSHITIPYPSPFEFYSLEYSKLHELD